MKNKTTYEMDDIMGLITRDLEEKGLAPDLSSVEIWARIDGARVHATEIEVEANVSWVGIPARDESKFRPASKLDADDSAPPGLLEEALSPRGRPTVTFGDLPPDLGEVGIDAVTAESTRIVRSGGAGPFSPTRVKRRLVDGESTEFPGTPPRGR